VVKPELKVDVSPSISREIGRNLNSASDEQLGRVVAMVDSMSARGAADEIIELVRPRLAVLKPERPLTLSRVLFAPLDPAIVHPRNWKPGTAALPRSALSVVSRSVMACLGDLPAELGQAAAGAGCADRGKLREIGFRLWPAAGAVMKDMGQPAEWRQQTGLPDDAWTQIREAMALVLSLARQIETILDTGGDEIELRLFLADNRACDERAFAVLIRILLARHPIPSVVLGAVANFRDRQTTRATDLAIGSIMEGAPFALRGIVDGSAALAAAEAVQLAVMLDAFERPEMRDRVRQLRIKALDACQSRLARCITEDVVASVRGAADGSICSIVAAEKGARDALRLEKAARALGGHQQVHQLLQRAANDIVGLVSDEVDAVDRLRLVELLLGPERAALLDGALTPTAASS
jgi:hypothetical protein